jgi:hypothetical protein
MTLPVPNRVGILLVVLLWGGQLAQAQQARVNGLNGRLAQQPEDTLKVQILCELSFCYYSSDAAKAYAQTALAPGPETWVWQR